MPTTRPNVIILRTAGTNCDLETAHAFELAGARAERVHLNRVLENPARLRDYEIMAIPGGFSYGDDIAAGRILANQIVHHLGDAMRDFVAAGKPVIGVCNGFQVLVKAGLLPGSIGGRTGQTVTLAHNDNGRFVCRWVKVRAGGDKCIWTKDLASEDDEPLELPIAHGEGRFVAADPEVMSAMVTNGQVALRYVGDNPNGSTESVAGLCDETGLVFGLMPHPERFVERCQHPAWTSLSLGTHELNGLAIFKNAVRHVGGR